MSGCQVFEGREGVAVAKMSNKNDPCDKLFCILTTGHSNLHAYDKIS